MPADLKQGLRPGRYDRHPLILIVNSVTDKIDYPISNHGGTMGTPLDEWPINVPRQQGL
jgi:hypothetical protein